MKFLRAPLLVIGLLSALAGCSAIERDPACVLAEKCDNALEEPSGDFVANDPVFGDDLNADGTAGQFGDVGTCWQNADTAKPCIQACKDFVKEQAAIAQGDGDQAVVDACGGAAAGEGEGEGEGE